MNTGKKQSFVKNAECKFHFFFSEKRGACLKLNNALSAHFSSKLKIEDDVQTILKSLSSYGCWRFFLFFFLYKLF